MRWEAIEEVQWNVEKKTNCHETVMNVDGKNWITDFEILDMRSLLPEFLKTKQRLSWMEQNFDCFLITFSFYLGDHGDIEKYYNEIVEKMGKRIPIVLVGLDLGYSIKNEPDQIEEKKRDLSERAKRLGCQWFVCDGGDKSLAIKAWESVIRLYADRFISEDEWKSLAKESENHRLGGKSNQLKGKKCTLM